MNQNLLPGRRHPVAALLSLLFAAVLAVLALWIDATPPSPRQADAAATEFSAERAAERLSAFAERPRPVGSRASDATRAYLVRELRAAGLQVRIQRGVGLYPAENEAILGRAQNVVATLPGNDSTGSVILAAHYDSVAAGPGAADDGSSVAAMLETVRALRADTPLRNDVVLVITDGEEAGLLGASTFTRDDPLPGRPGVVLNWEARGSSGPSLTFQTSPDNARLVELFAAGAPHPNGSSALAELYRILPNDTDFSRLSERLPGLDAAFIESSAFYHTPQDSIANLDRASLQQHGANMLGLSREFGGADLSTLDADSDSTYFRFLGLLVTYPEQAAVALGIVALLLVITLFVLLRNRGLVGVPGVLVALGTFPIAVAVAVGLCYGGSALLPVLRPEFGDALYNGLPFGLTGAAIGIACVAGWYALLRARFGSAALSVACLGWLAVLGGVCLVLVPGMAFLFTVPGLLATVGVLFALGLREYNSVAPQLALTVASLAGVVLYVPFSVLVFIGLRTSGGIEGTAIAVILCGLVLLPALDPLFGRRARSAALLPGAALVLALLLFGSGLVIGQYDRDHPSRSMLAYVLRPDLGEARWVSADVNPASWGRGYANDPDRAKVPSYFPDEPLWTGPARRTSLQPPRASLVPTRSAGTTVRISSGRAARQLTVVLDDAVGRVTVRAAGERPVTVRATSSPFRLVFVDLPRQGIELSTETTNGLGFTVYDQTQGLSTVPGYRPRPDGVERSASSSDDSVLVGKEFRFPAR